MPPDPRVLVGVGAWVERDGSLLMIRRGGTEGHAAEGHGTWSVPGGWLDHGETPEVAAVRETSEETGARVEAIDRMEYVVVSADDGTWRVTLFVRCEWVDGEPFVTEPEKCPEVAWVPLRALYAGECGPLFAPLADLLRRTA